MTKPMFLVIENVYGSLYTFTSREEMQDYFNNEEWEPEDVTVYDLRDAKVVTVELVPATIKIAGFDDEPATEEPEKAIDLRDTAMVFKNARLAYINGELQAQKPGDDHNKCAYSGPCAIGVSIPVEKREMLDLSLIHI